MAKRSGTKAISESKRFTAKIEERKTNKANSIIGRSKKVLRNLTDPSIVILPTKIKSEARTTVPKRICLGSIKKSVVKLTNKIGKAKNRSPNKSIEMLFK